MVGGENVKFEGKLEKKKLNLHMWKLSHRKNKNITELFSSQLELE